jgi:hypothetical protein
MGPGTAMAFAEATSVKLIDALRQIATVQKDLNTVVLITHSNSLFHYSEPLRGAD